MSPYKQHSTKRSKGKRKNAEKPPVQETQNKEEKRPESWQVQAAKKLWWRVHCKFPNAIPSPHRDDRAYRKERDLQQNSSTRVPEEENLRLMALWGVELFGPSEIDNLYVSLEKLAWDADRIGRPGSGAVDWIKEQRMYGSEGSFNIGVVQRRDEKKFFPRDYFAPMPKEVDYLIAEIFQISATLTCVLVCFVLKEEHARQYETELNTDRKSVNEAIRGKTGYCSLDVNHLKQRAIDNARSDYRNIVIDWFAENLSGYFCQTDDGTRLPTAELISTNSEVLLRNAADINFPTAEWARILINSSHFHTWRNIDCPGLRLCFDEFTGDARFHTFVCLRRSDVTEQSLKYFGARGDGAYVAYTYERLSGILAHYASIALLQEARRTLKLSRQMLKNSVRSHRKVLNTLESIISFFDRSLAIPTIASELQKKSEHLSSYRWHCSEFDGSPYDKESEVPKIAETLRAHTQYLSTQVLSEEQTNREHFEQIATIIGARESVKAQRRMEVMTTVSIVVAFGSLIAAVPTLKRWVAMLIALF